MEAAATGVGRAHPWTELATMSELPCRSRAPTLVASAIMGMLMSTTATLRGSNAGKQTQTHGRAGAGAKGPGAGDDQKGQTGKGRDRATAFPATRIHI